VKIDGPKARRIAGTIAPFPNVIVIARAYGIDETGAPSKANAGLRWSLALGHSGVAAASFFWPALTIALGLLLTAPPNHGDEQEDQLPFAVAFRRSIGIDLSASALPRLNPDSHMS
jgi:hypothetical protein